MISGNTAHIQRASGQNIDPCRHKETDGWLQCRLIEKSLSLRRLITIRLLRKVLNGGLMAGNFTSGRFLDICTVLLRWRTKEGVKEAGCVHTQLPI